MAAHIDTVASLFIFAGIIQGCLSQLELDERFLEFRKEGMWLVKFYAPWCGHCKKLEPIYKEVANDLRMKGSSVRVARVDCTRFPSVASELAVRGFPTVIFFNGDTSHVHQGDRTKDDLLEFVGRASGPTLRKLSSEGKFKEASRLHQNTVFFLYIGDGDEKEDLFEKYSFAAKANAVESYFYYGQKRILGEKSEKVKQYPSLLVVKDGEITEFESSNGFVSASSLETWINRERHATFPRLSGPGLNKVAHSAKLLVILGVDSERIKNESSLDAGTFATTKKVALQYKPRRDFQFLWMDEVETLQSIAVSFLTPPVLMVLDTDTQLYYMAPAANLTSPQLIGRFLESVVNGEEAAYGGLGYLMKIKRLLFDFVTTIISIWQASRILFLMMFCLPTLVVSVVCYSLCCMDTVDDVGDGEEEDDEDEDGLGDGDRRRGRGDDAPPPPFNDLSIGDREPPSYAEAVGDLEPKEEQDKKDD